MIYLWNFGRKIFFVFSRKNLPSDSFMDTPVIMTNDLLFISANCTEKDILVPWETRTGLTASKIPFSGYLNSTFTCWFLCTSAG